jgi:hypothetical protein
MKALDKKSYEHREQSVEYGDWMWGGSWSETVATVSVSWPSL